MEPMNWAARPTPKDQGEQISMNEQQDIKSELLGYINTQIKANDAVMTKTGERLYYYDGANDALKELAVNFGLVSGYDYFRENL